MASGRGERDRPQEQQEQEEHDKVPSESSEFLFLAQKEFDDLNRYVNTFAAYTHQLVAAEATRQKERWHRKVNDNDNNLVRQQQNYERVRQQAELQQSFVAHMEALEKLRTTHSRLTECCPQGDALSTESGMPQPEETLLKKQHLKRSHRVIRTCSCTSDGRPLIHDLTGHVVSFAAAGSLEQDLSHSERCMVALASLRASIVELQEYRRQQEEMEKEEEMIR